jgi:hypothetical protein
MNCPSCGATINTGRMECPYCGSSVQQPEIAPSEQPRNYRLPAQGRELEELLRYTPSSMGVGVSRVVMTVFGVVFTAFAIFFITLSKRGGAPGFFQLFPLIFVFVGLLMVIAGLRGIVKLAASPLERLPAVVIGKREHYSSNSDGSGSTSYHVTIEVEGGERKEHQVRGALYSSVERGDAGVAYLKGGFLLDFRRVRIPRT